MSKLLYPRVFLTTALAAGLFAPLATLSAQDGAAGAPAATPEIVKIAPADAAKVMEKLAELRKERDKARTNALQAGIDRIQQALASETGPVDLYKDCMKAENFTGQSDSMNGEYRNWKEKQEETLKDGDFRHCLRAHLQYLALSLEFLAIQEKQPQAILPKVANYLTDLQKIKIPARGPGNDLMYKPLAQSVFVQNLNLDTEIKRLKNWEQAAGNEDGIETVTVLPLLREHHKDQLIPFWDRKIERERAAAAQETLASRAENFRTQRLPRLEWDRAQDMLFVGKGQAAYQEMFRIVSSNTAHPDFTKWANALEAYLKPSLPPAATPPAGSTTGAPAATGGAGS